MIDSILRGLRRPEYVHVLLNPLPVYGLLVAWIGLLIAFFSKSRRAQIAALVLVSLPRSPHGQFMNLANREKIAFCR